MKDFKKAAQAATSGSFIMEGREKMEMTLLIATYPEGVTVNGADLINGDSGLYAAVTFVEDPKKYMNEDYLTMLCLYFKLPDWISRLIFKRAHFQLDEENKRHQALLHILRVQSNDGVEAANDYLTRCHLATLAI